MGRIVSLEQVKLYLDLDGRRTDSDAILETLIRGAEDACERHTRRRLWPRPEPADDGTDTLDPVTEIFNTRGKRWVRVPDVRSIASATLGGSAIAASSLQVFGEPPHRRIRLLDPPLLGSTDPEASQVLTITGRWGFNPPPPVAEDVVCLLVSRAFKERAADYADTVENIEGGSRSYFRELPGRAKFELSTLRAHNFAVL